MAWYLSPALMGVLCLVLVAGCSTPSPSSGKFGTGTIVTLNREETVGSPLTESGERCDSSREGAGQHTIEKFTGKLHKVDGSTLGIAVSGLQVLGRDVRYSRQTLQTCHGSD